MFEIFSTREVAIIIWSTIFIVTAIFIVKFQQLLGLLKSFFVYKIQLPLWFMFIYITGITTCLYYLNIWNFGLLKDTIIWSIAFSTILFFNINKAKDLTYFKPVILENFKAIVILEFISNFYTFSFITEMTLVPIMTFIGLLQIAAEYSAKTNSEHLKVANFLKTFFNLVGISIFSYVSYETIKSYNLLLTVQNIKSLLLPFVYTFLLIPFLYLLALYINYEVLFIRIPNLVKEKKKQRKLKRNILLIANLNLSNLNKISTNLNWDLIEKNGIKKSIKNIIK